MRAHTHIIHLRQPLYFTVPAVHVHSYFDEALAATSPPATAAHAPSSAAAARHERRYETSYAGAEALTGAGRLVSHSAITGARS